MSRASNLGLGYIETLSPLDSWEQDWTILVEKCPLAAELTWSDFVKDSETYLEDIRKLVAAMCKGN